MKHRATALTAGVFVLGLFAPTLPARPFDSPDTPATPSHRPLGGGLGDMANPEAVLAQRLAMARYRKGDLATLAKKLLEDKALLESLRGQFSPEVIDRLKVDFEKGKLNENDPDLRRLIDKVKESPKVDQQIQADLAKMAEKRTETHQDPDGVKATPGVPPNQTEPPAWRRGTSRANDWFKDGLGDFVKDFDKWAQSPSGKSWGGAMRKFGNRVDAGRASAANIGERAPGLSRWFGKMNGWNPTFQPPSLGNPSLPNVGVPSGGSLAGASGVLVFLLAALLLGLLLWRGRDWLVSLKRAGQSAWKLGPWPVRPEDVMTRADLVRAFEHLALLCLGPAARTCHHLELGERIGGQPALDGQRRRESAADLSRLYERARYTPDQEPLPGEDLHRARRELAYLAGANA